jgi:choline kinase
MVVIIIKAIVLAAGTGSRLGENLPKSMIKLDKNNTILDLQLENLKKIVKIEDIVVVVGFKSDLITEKYPDLSYIYNKNYLKTNTSKSLLLALKKIKEQDVLWLNGDVVFEPEISTLILEHLDENLVCVNNSQVSEEEVKYTVDLDGYIKDISKTIKNGSGEAVGINFIKKRDLRYFISCLNDCEDMDYFEKAIELAIGKGVKFRPLNIKDNYCTEVDFQHDLKKARNFFKRRHNK